MGGATLLTRGRAPRLVELHLKFWLKISNCPEWCTNDLEKCQGGMSCKIQRWYCRNELRSRISSMMGLRVPGLTFCRIMKRRSKKLVFEEQSVVGLRNSARERAWSRTNFGIRVSDRLRSCLKHGDRFSSPLRLSVSLLPYSIFTFLSTEHARC